MRKKNTRKAMQEAADRVRSQSSEEVPAQAVPSGDSEIECPECAEVIKARAKVCRFCGATTASPRGRGRGRSKGRTSGAGVTHVVHHGGTKSGGIAAVLGFFFPGLGHVYAGQIAKGLVFMFLVVPGFLLMAMVGAFGALASGGVRAVAGWVCLFAVAEFGLWVWQMVDAYNAAEASNRRRSSRFGH